MGGSLLSRVKFFFGSLADFIFPPICYGCDEEVDNGLVCESCRRLLFTSELDVCVRCGRPCLPDAGVCGRCKFPLAVSRVRAVGVYQPPFQGLIQALKYSEKTALVPVLGAALALLLLQDTELKRADFVCPVPLHPARLRERGYNQALLLAKEVSVITGIELIEPLIRKKNTQSQTELKDESARLKNVQGAFGIKPGVGFNGERLIVIDDVMTTGATISQAATELRKAGAGDVMGLVMAAAIAPKGKG
ncbi:MAG: ComF family protein [bacterium]